ncbi:MAG TPA: flagellar protein FlaG [Clostridia bacterium]|nr:flagellar protein FlaG [Clostridia bacterium]HXK71482.1 flagellar protein FlaG [Clostridia bacterium]
MNDSYIDSLTGVSAVRQVESQVNKENQTVRQQTESRSDFKTFNEELQFCDNEKQLDEQLETLNNTLRNENKKVEYSIYEETNTVIFRVIDTKSEKVIKEIPSTKLIDFSVAVLERFGLIADKEV